MCLLVVIDSKINTQNFANLYVGVSETNKILPEGEHPPTHLLHTLQKSHTILGLVSQV